MRVAPAVIGGGEKGWKPPPNSEASEGSLWLCTRLNQGCSQTMNESGIKPKELSSSSHVALQILSQRIFSNICYLYLGDAASKADALPLGHDPPPHATLLKTEHSGRSSSFLKNPLLYLTKGGITIQAHISLVQHCYLMSVPRSATGMPCGQLQSNVIRKLRSCSLRLLSQTLVTSSTFLCKRAECRTQRLESKQGLCIINETNPNSLDLTCLPVQPHRRRTGIIF